MIHIFYVLSIDTNRDHITGHTGPFYDGNYGHFWPFDWYGPTKYGHEYGFYWYLWKEHVKCGSSVKKELKKLNWLKSYGQIKFNSENMAVSFVFWPQFGQNLKLKVATFPMLHFFTSLSVWVQNGQHNGIKVRKIWFLNKKEIQDTLAWYIPETYLKYTW